MTAKGKDEEDLCPLLPPGTSLRDYVDSDDHVATQTTIDDNWERALLDEAKVATDGEVDSSSEDGDKDGEKVVSSTTTYRFHGDVIRRVTWASGTTGWQKIFGWRAPRVFFAWIHALFTLILLTHKIMIMFSICVGYLWHCGDGSF